MASYVIATIKSWNIQNAEKLKKRFPEHQFILVTEKEKLNYGQLTKIAPEYIFFPHWSWVIPQVIYENFNCVVFHMTDLPFGRGGSPLQNLLVRGIYHTKISAIKVSKGMDTGAVYFKEALDLSYGNADNIFSRMSEIIFYSMMPRFFGNTIVASEQQGEPVVFKRRTSDQSEIPDGLNSRQIYDFIRMLDGEGYPAAYKKVENGKIYFRNARLENDVVFAQAEFRRTK